MNNKTKCSIVDKEGFPVIYSKEEKEAIQYILSKIDGKDVDFSIKEVARFAENNGIVIIYPYRLFFVEFDGAIEDEIGFKYYQKIYFTDDGNILESDCNNAGCPNFLKLALSCKNSIIAQNTVEEMCASIEAQNSVYFSTTEMDGKFTGRGVIIPHRLLKAGDY